MIANLPPHVEYKDSGVEWLGSVPAHWQCKPHRALFREIKDQGHIEEPLLSVTISRGVIPQEDLLKSTSKKDSSNLDKSKYKLVQPGDVAYNKMRAWQGAAGASCHRGIVSPAYIVQRLRGDGESQYFHHLFRTPGFAKEAERWSYGITSDQWSLRPEHFKMIYSPVPPPEEQAAIVRFFAEADRRINRLIRNKRRLIELLNEQKQAIITQAVTRGLDPSVPMKASGVDMIGDIPEHWSALRVRHLVHRIDQGISPQAENRLADEPGTWGVLKSGCVNRGVFRAEQHKRLPDAVVFDEHLAIHPGDVLVSRACGSADLVGSVGLVTEHPYRLILSDKTFRLQLRQACLNEFFVAAMNSLVFRQQVRLAISGAEGLANNLPLSELRDLVLPCPPVDEALHIAKSLSKRLVHIESTSERLQRELQLLREYRTRLISDVVTGKLDVRGAAADLPDPADIEPEPADALDDDADLDAAEEHLEEEIAP